MQFVNRELISVCKKSIEYLLFRSIKILKLP